MGKLQIFTPDEPGTAAAITSFRLHGDGNKEGNESYVRELLDRYGPFTVARDGPAQGAIGACHTRAAANRRSERAAGANPV